MQHDCIAESSFLQYYHAAIKQQPMFISPLFIYITVRYLEVLFDRLLVHKEPNAVGASAGTPGPLQSYLILSDPAAPVDQPNLS